MIPVYSIAKPFLAQAILELGIPLDATVGEYLPDLAPVYGGRVIGALLNHTSGLDDYGSLPEYLAAVAAGESAWTREEVLARCSSLPHANEGFQYSNIGYLLLRMILESQTGLSYFGAIQELVLQPLGITGFAEWETATDVAPGYDPRWVYSGTFLADPEAIAPGITTLAKHREATLGLSAGRTAVPYKSTGFDDPGYTYGFMSSDLPPSYVGHGGGGPGFQLMVLVNTSTWQSALECATDGGLDQSAAIGRLRKKLP